MVKRVNGYVIRATDNLGRRSVHGRFFKKSEANKELRKLLSPGKVRKGTGYMKGKKIYLTSYRQGISGGGINNPRIKQVRLIR